jgi:hypothetical protein
VAGNKLAKNDAPEPSAVLAYVDEEGGWRRISLPARPVEEDWA